MSLIALKKLRHKADTHFCEACRGCHRHPVLLWLIGSPHPRMLCPWVTVSE